MELAKRDEMIMQLQTAIKDNQNNVDFFLLNDTKNKSKLHQKNVRIRFLETRFIVIEFSLLE